MGAALEFQLPEVIIQHIQSFLSGKEAAQTTILSKSWYAAWLTRPNFDFDERYFIKFVNGHFQSSFFDFVKKTVQRYDNLNRRIESLSLTLVANDPGGYSLARELIAIAIKMGAVDLDFKIAYQGSSFAFPNEVIESLGGCKIDEKVNCWRLKSLCFDSVYVEGDFIWNIISSCPLIVKLPLFETHVFSGRSTSRIIMGSIGDGMSILHEFHNVKCLFLSWIAFRTRIFNDFSSKFPCLKDLSIHNCDFYRGIQISSPSLECISFIQVKMLGAKFDVPRIRKFMFSGPNIPSLFFKTTTGNWESDISIKRCTPPSGLWFFKLNKLLKKLSQSKVSLYLKIELDEIYDCVEYIQDLPKPVVENLTIDDPSSVCPAFFGILLRCCRPVFIAHSLFGQYNYEELGNSSIEEVAYKRLMQQASLICSSANQSMCGPCDLGEVNWEFFDATVSAWRSLSSDSSTGTSAEKRVRVHLRWGRESAVSK